MKKSQSTLELATTYSWAMIIILIVILTIIFYSEYEESQISVLECKLGPQFNCEEVILDEYGQFEIKFVNNVNDNIIIEELSIDSLTYDCPALPITVKQGNLGRIQCNIEGSFKKSDIESLDLSIQFKVKDNPEEFSSNGKIDTEVVLGIDNFEIDCDEDGDGKDKYGCGDDNDCNDQDPLNWFSACTEDSDCSAGYSCVDAYSCNAYCENTCDGDGDGKDNYFDGCGGLDCNDGAPSIWKAECYTDANCPTGFICGSPGQCSNGCIVDPDIGGNPGLPGFG